MERGLRALEPRHQILERNGRAARGEDRVELEYAVEFIHCIDAAPVRLAESGEAVKSLRSRGLWTQRAEASALRVTVMVHEPGRARRARNQPFPWHRRCDVLP